MMAEANDKISILSQNLTDAGCNEQMAKTCMSFVEKGELQAMLPLLTRYRTTLLNSIRTGQKQLDCLDYLIYKIRKESI